MLGVVFVGFVVGLVGGGELGFGLFLGLVGRGEARRTALVVFLHYVAAH